VAKGFWTDERIARLKRLHADGMNYSDIARTLGCERGSVSGKVARLKLTRVHDQSFRIVAGRKAAAIARARSPHPKVKVHVLPKNSEADLRLYERIVNSSNEAPPGSGAGRKGLIDLETSDCRWPIGDPKTPEFHFCAISKVDGTSYCEFHARKAFQPPARQRDQTHSIDQPRKAILTA
jgi:GcrA cell cycle regulator